MKRSIIALTVIALCGAASASAQGIPALGAAKAAANRAVNASNRQLHEETGQAITKKPVNQPNAAASAAKPATQPATTPAKPGVVARPAAGKDTTKKAAEAPATAVFNREVFSY